MPLTADTTRRLTLDGEWQVLPVIPNTWKWTRAGETNGWMPPSTSGWIPATVPGHVVADAAASGLVADPYIGLNSLAAEWLAMRDWIYRREFTVPAELRNARVILHFEGVDDVCTVFLNGTRLGRHAGMNQPFEYDVTDVVTPDPNVLTVMVEEAPMEPESQGQLGSTTKVRNWKARFTYWWDFSARLVSTGIWDSVWLESRGVAHIRDLWTRSRLTTDGWELDALCTVEGDATGLELVAELLNGDRVVAGGAQAAAAGEQSLTISAPAVREWNVNGAGDQNLYTARLQLRRAADVVATGSVPVGFRTIEFRRTPGAGEDALPYQPVVNGEPVFIRGWNWVPVDQMYGVLREDRYRNLIAHAKAAGCNLLRVWGGGHLEREIFYDLCDEAGILVWQEFIQSSSGDDSEPAVDDEYHAYIDAQASAMVRRRRMHPSLAIWCGGNELAHHDTFPPRLPLGLDHPTVARLRDLVAQLDPERLFLPTSSSGPVFDLMEDRGLRGHDVHGPWNYLGDGIHETFHDRMDPMLYSEFGAEGASDVDVIERYLPGSTWPPDRTNPAWVNHGGWWWSAPEGFQGLFGSLDNISDFSRASQWTQAHALGYAIEAQRRREDLVAGVIPWQLNEPWPNGMCTNAVQYDGRAKPAFWAIARAYAPVLVSAVLPRLGYAPGDTFRAQLWVSGALATPVTLQWDIVDAMSGHVQDSGTIDVGAGVTPRAVGSSELRLPGEPRVWALLLALRDGDDVVATNQYVFSSVPGGPLAPLLDAPTGRIAVRQAGDGTVELSAEDATVFGLRASAADGRPGPGVTSGWVAALFPGSPVCLRIDEGRTVRVDAWNAEPVDVTWLGER